MSISYQAIIQRMKKELDQLNDGTASDEIIAKMYAIKSLADVIIESKSSFEQTNQSVDHQSTYISEAEAKAMGIKRSTNEQIKKVRLDEDDANGDSIFDF
ncbi:YwdI family protein [Bacillaceae bacterium W0354]